MITEFVPDVTAAPGNDRVSEKSLKVWLGRRLKSECAIILAKCSRYAHNMLTNISTVYQRSYANQAEFRAPRGW